MILDSDRLDVRRTIEALRSGVPSDAAVRSLGTTQHEIETGFANALRDKEARRGAAPLVIDANFGDGKSHLLQCLRVKAESEGFATSAVVVGPDAPIGNAQVVLKVISEQARLPGRTGKALHELAGVAREPIADLNLWVRDAPIADRFRALLRIYQVTQDEELRVQILEDIEGKPLAKSRITAELRSLGELSRYQLTSPRNTSLAHDRIEVLAQFCRTHGHSGLIVFFDEVERISNFSFKARLAAYEQLGWWRHVCLSGLVPIYAVFTQTSGAIEQCLADKGDETRLQTSLLQEGPDDFARAGIDLLRHTTRLEKITRDQLESLQHSLRDLYGLAYGLAPSHVELRSALTTVRSEIRRWITEWDLGRHFPGYRTNIRTNEVVEDLSETPDELLSKEQDGP
jgi:hypothetical protein